jgi:hypothetical protein
LAASEVFIKKKGAAYETDPNRAGASPAPMLVLSAMTGLPASAQESRIVIDAFCAPLHPA